MSKAASSTGFVYLAAPARGGMPRVGVRAAANRAALADGLRRERLVLRQSVAMPSWAKPPAGLRLQDHAVLNDQLAALLSRGVPLVEALDVVSSTVSVAARPVVESIRAQVGAGASFSEACRRSGAFDDVTVAVYRAAERTGDLAGSAKQLAATARRTLLVRGKAATLLIYPAIVLTVAFFVAAIMILFVVPLLGEQLRALSDNLPWFTEVLVAIGTFGRSNLLAIAGVLVAVVVAGVLARAKLWAMVGKATARAPLVRDVVLAQEAARFFATMAAMNRSGVPLADALATANQAINQPRLRSQMETLRSRLVEGGVLRQLIEQVTALPVATRKLLIAAERSGDLEEAFTMLAADMTEEVERRSARLTAMLQPLVVVFMFLVIAVILMAVFVPMITSGQALQGP